MITQSQLKKLFNYNKETGLFTRISSPGVINVIGKVAGARNTQGYIAIGIGGKDYFAHRLAFLYVDGYFPEHEVDHLNGTRFDNRWKNLKHATRTCNSQNTGMNKNNTSGFKGVTFAKARNVWISQIDTKHGHIRIGQHQDPISAALARCEYEKCCPEWTCNVRGVNFVKLREMGYKI